MRVLKTILLLRRNVNISKASLRQILADPTWPIVERVARSLVLAKEISEAQLQGLLNSPWVGQRLPLALVTAKLLMQKGIKPGPEMGILLKEAFRAQLNEEIQNLEEAKAWVSCRLKT